MIGSLRGRRDARKILACPGGAARWNPGGPPHSWSIAPSAAANRAADLTRAFAGTGHAPEALGCLLVPRGAQGDLTWATRLGAESESRASNYTYKQSQKSVKCTHTVGATFRAAIFLARQIPRRAVAESGVPRGDESHEKRETDVCVHPESEHPKGEQKIREHEDARSSVRRLSPRSLVFASALFFSRVAEERARADVVRLRRARRNGRAAPHGGGGR